MKKSPKELLEVINKVKDKVKQSDTYKDLCDKYEVDYDYIDLVPMCFSDLDVSARTQHGCIYFNYKLIKDGAFENDDHYMIHELEHVLQQTCLDGPTRGSAEDDYLDNEFEQEGFRSQTKYLSETRDDEAAENYIEKVLEHHDVPSPERKKRRKQLLQLAHDLALKK